MNLWLEPFYFRGLKFREHSEGIGIQVYDPDEKRWHYPAVLNRRILERDYAEVPDLAKWGKRREFLGTLRFPTETAKRKTPSPWGLPEKD